MKKYIINLKSEDRAIHSKAEINKKAVRRLYWFIEPDGGNTPLKYVPAKDRGGFGEAGMMKFSMNTNKQGVCEHDEFRMSACGLDKFKVSVGLKKDGSDKRTNEDYEVWRRVYFSVRYMDPKFKLPFGPLHDEYRKHGIWPEEIAPAGGSAKVKYTEVITEYDEAAALVQPVTEHHLEGRVVLVDRIWIKFFREFTVKTKKLSFRLDASKWSKDVQSSWVLWISDHPGTGEVGGVGIASYDFTPHMKRTGDREITVTIPSGTPIGTALGEAKDRGDLAYKFRIWFVKVLNGYARSDIGRIVIANRTRGSQSRPLSPRQGTVIHEMGHGLGMVPAKIQEYNEFNGNPIKSGLKKNPTQYMNGGGHCKTGAGGSDPNYRDGTCVMFHYGHDGRSLQFCSSCAPIVKRRNLDRDGMPWP